MHRHIGPDGILKDLKSYDALFAKLLSALMIEHAALAFIVQACDGTLSAESIKAAKEIGGFSDEYIKKIKDSEDIHVSAKIQYWYLTKLLTKVPEVVDIIQNKLSFATVKVMCGDNNAIS